MAFAEAASPALTRTRTNVRTMGATSGLLNLAGQSWNPIIPLLLVRAGAPTVAVVLTYALVNLLGSLAQYAGGLLSDRHGARLLIGVPTIFSGCLWFVMAFSGHWQGMAAAYVLINVVFGIQSPAFVTMIADSVAPTARVAAFARYQLFVSVAYVAGPLLGAFVLLPLVPSWLYISFTGVCYLAMAFTRLRLLVEPRVAAAVPQASQAPPRDGMARALAQAREAVFGTPQRRRLLVLTVGVSCLVALTINGPFFALVAHGQDGLAGRLVDVLFAVGALGMLAASFLATTVARRLGNSRTLAVGLVVHGLAAGAFALRMGLWGGTALFVLAFAGYQLAWIAYGTVRSTLASGPGAGAAIGGAAAIGGVAVFLALALAGVLESAWGRGGPLWLAAGLALATAVVALWPAPGGAGPPGPQGAEGPGRGMAVVDDGP